MYPKIDDIKYLQPKNIAPQPYILPSIAELKNKPHKPIIFTEGEKKTLCLIKNGYYAIGLAGVWEFKNKKQGEPFLKELDEWNWKERTVHICFDADALFNSQVLKAEIELALNLYFRGAKVFIIRLPQPNHTEKVGVDDFIAQKGIEAFRQLYNEALPFTKAYKKEYMDEVLNRLAQLLTQLKDVDKFQFEKLKMELQKVWGISEKKFSYLLALKTESLQQKQEEPEYTQEEEKQAEELLKQPDILDRMVKLTEATGHIGEEINKKVLYLSAISIKTDKAISVFVKGTSSAGKNSLVDTIRALLPNKACKKLSDISSKALYHVKDNDISHKILYITETDGGQQSDYPLRLISSENELTYTYPIKNPQTGEFTTIEKHIKAEGTAIWQTTTSLKLTVDNENRAIDLYIDESEAQTRRILLQQAKKIDGNFEPQKRIWRCAFSKLENLPVVIPYAEYLAERYPTDKIRSRRDFSKLLKLIEAHCLLYQKQREKDKEGRLIATLEDYEEVYKLSQIVFRQTLCELSQKEEDLLKKLQEEFNGVEFSIRDCKDLMKGAYSTLKKYIKILVEKGYLAWNEEKGKKSRYEVIKGIEDNFKLPTPDEIENYLSTNRSQTTNNTKTLLETRKTFGDAQNSQKYPKTQVEIRHISGYIQNSQKNSETDNDFPKSANGLRDEQVKKYKQHDNESLQPEPQPLDGDQQKQNPEPPQTLQDILKRERKEDPDAMGF